MEEIYRWLKIQLQKLDVKIHYNTEVDEALIERIDPDVLVFATGSKPLAPHIPGMENSKITVTTVADAMAHTEKIGDNVLVYDNIGNWQGGGVADYCQRLGVRVTVVCSSANIGVDIENGQAYLLIKRLYENGAKVIPSHSLARIEDEKVIVENVYNHSPMEIEGIDTILIADQSRSENALYKKFKEKREQVYSCGDCVAPRGVEQAIFEAELLARDI